MKNLIFYTYALLIMALVLLLARPIINFVRYPIVTYVLISYGPLFFIMRAMVNVKYREILSYLYGVLLLIIVLIFRCIYL
ncbi:hypothetical protein SAMN05216464_103104 [Mucilaginibacter pineti]|uniref:Uncharacterized protein n=1 Tax=Mucilaginibacter pineti TaxID=1391627 RepID=A0A1G6YWU1_9SPHI|nr:hypothetical protein SAMN05216464_103104 [Mucilaginibacter pineti]